MRYFCYHEYSETGDVQTIISLIQIVRIQIQSHAKVGQHYPSTSIALDDWIVVNWAYECDRHGVDLNIINKSKE